MKIYIISTVISLVVLFISIVLLYNFFIYIDPPITSDGHKYMPTEQVTKSIFCSLFISIILFFVSVKIQKNRK